MAPNVVNLSVSVGGVVKKKALVRVAKFKRSFALPLGDARVKLDWIIYLVRVRPCLNHGQLGHNVPNPAKSENKCVGESASRLVVKVN